MMAFTVLCMLSSVAIAFLHTGTRLSMQARCAGNLRTIWTTTKTYKLDYRAYPPEYPESALTQVFRRYDLPPETFKCLEYETEQETETKQTTDDTYGRAYVAPREEAEEDLLLCACPYHDANETTVILTSRGQTTSVDSLSLNYSSKRTGLALDKAKTSKSIALAAVEPLATFDGGTLFLWGNGKILFDNKLQTRLIATYEQNDVSHLALKVLEDQEGGMTVQLAPGSQMTVVSEAGLVVLDTTEASGYFEFVLEVKDGVTHGTVIVGSGDAHLYGRNLSRRD
jgi:hypothetical protein